MELTNLGVIREIMAKHGMRFTKSLGQNFLVNPSVCPRIAELGGVTGETNVLEIGPGIGTLTMELARRAKKVAAIELDERLLPILSETLAEFDNVSILHGDAMKIDLADLIARQFDGGDLVVCANLPYYITSPLIMRLLEENLPLRAVTVMVQKEAALRICAPHPSRNAGAITAAISYYAKTKLLFSVSPGSFYPPPKVESAVLRLDRYEHPPIAVKSEATLFRVIRAAFSQRRKILLNCLASGMELSKESVTRALEQAGVSSQARAEDLSLEEFGRIADAIDTI